MKPMCTCCIKVEEQEQKKTGLFGSGFFYEKFYSIEKKFFELYTNYMICKNNYSANKWVRFSLKGACTIPFSVMMAVMYS